MEFTAEIQISFSFNERTFFCNKSDLHITLNECFTGFDPFLDFFLYACVILGTVSWKSKYFVFVA